MTRCKFQLKFLQDWPPCDITYLLVGIETAVKNEQFSVAKKYGMMAALPQRQMPMNQLVAQALCSIYTRFEVLGDLMVLSMTVVKNPISWHFRHEPL